MTDAQTHIDLHFAATKTTETEIEVRSNSAPTGKNQVADKLKGKLKIEDYTELEKIKLEDHELEELIIVNCPKLKEIVVRKNKLTKLDFTRVKTDGVTADPAPTNILKNLVIGMNNDLEEVSFEYCPDLETIKAPGNKKLAKVWGLDRLNKLKEVIIEEGLINYIYQGKLKNLKDVKKVARELSGSDLADTSDLNNIKTEIAAGVNSNVSQWETARKNAEKEAQEAKDKLGGVETERDQLKQQLENMKKELGLAKDATEQQALEKIKELMKRPSGPTCTHTDYDTIKNQKDNLQTELESKKRRISELENSNKDNDTITKQVLTDSTNTNWNDWGIKLSSEQKEKFQSANTAQDVENTRNEIIKKEMTKLKDENNSSFYLNLGLGVLTVISLLLLAWIMMRQQINLPKTEPEKKKD